MNIQHLRYAVEVEKAGSISRAAELLYMGQPNLSKAIRELEQSLQITIFHRTSKGSEITPKGREFLRYAKNILAQVEEMEALGSEAAQRTQSLRISVPRASYVVDAFTHLVRDLDMQRPVSMNFQETNSLQAIENVAQGRAELGIIRCRVEYQEYFHALLDERDLQRRDLFSASYKLIFQKKSPLAGYDIVPREALSDFIEIIHGDTSLPQMTLETVETERGQTPGEKKIYVYERGSQFDLLARVPMTYMWVSPMPRDLLARNGLAQHACDQSAQFKDMLIFPKRHRFTALQEQFLAQVEKTICAI